MCQFVKALLHIGHKPNATFPVCQAIFFTNQKNKKNQVRKAKKKIKLSRNLKIPVTFIDKGYRGFYFSVFSKTFLKNLSFSFLSLSKMPGKKH